MHELLALIYAFDQENIAVTGTGTLDGQAVDENWWELEPKRRGPPKHRPLATDVKL